MAAVPWNGVELFQKFCAGFNDTGGAIRNGVDGFAKKPVCKEC